MNQKIAQEKRNNLLNSSPEKRLAIGKDKNLDVGGLTRSRQPNLILHPAVHSVDWGWKRSSLRKLFSPPFSQLNKLAKGRWKMKKFFLFTSRGFSERDITGRYGGKPAPPVKERVEFLEEGGRISGVSGPDVHPLSARAWRRKEISLAEAREMVESGVEATLEALEALKG